MFQGLLNILLLVFAVFAFDQLGITNSEMLAEENKIEAEHHTEPIAKVPQKFTDRIAAKSKS